MALWISLKERSEIALARSHLFTLILFILSVNIPEHHRLAILKSIWIAARRCAMGLPWSPCFVYNRRFRSINRTLRKYLPLVASLDLTRGQRAVLLTYFRLYKSLDLQAKVDYESVAATLTESEQQKVDQVCEEFRLFGSRFDFSFRHVLKKTHFLGPKGFMKGSCRPTGQKTGREYAVSLVLNHIKSVTDFFANLSADGRSHVETLFQYTVAALTYCPEEGERPLTLTEWEGEFLFSTLSPVWGEGTKAPPPNGHIGYRLTAFNDGGGKARIIGIVNPFVQSLLKPLHDGIFSWLKRQREDYTFDQDGIKKTYFEWVRLGKPIYSLDLSSATDKLPLSVQLAILESSLPLDVIESLRFLFTHPYLVPPKGPRHEDVNLEPYSEWHQVSYGRGQGMGIYGSWALLALTHHVIIRHLAEKNRLEWRNNYGIVGDDIVIADADLAAEYLRFMTDELSMKISLHKSVTPSSFKGMEFCSRLFTSRGEVSPLPTGVIRNNNTFELLQTMLFGKSKLNFHLMNMIPWYLLEVFLILDKVHVRSLPISASDRFQVSGANRTLIRDHFSTYFRSKIVLHLPKIGSPDPWWFSMLDMPDCPFDTPDSRLRISRMDLSELEKLMSVALLRWSMLSLHENGVKRAYDLAFLSTLVDLGVLVLEFHTRREGPRAPLVKRGKPVQVSWKEYVRRDFDTLFRHHRFIKNGWYV
uniref:RdRp n=1 Tax=Halichondria panicea mitovirus 2 TaxID=2950718 RepID=A0A9N7AB17_9VIRU|nr:TPA_asm: RdRp [Halichondria panicea mitovirus 2]